MSKESIKGVLIQFIPIFILLFLLDLHDFMFHINVRSFEGLHLSKLGVVQKDD